MVLADAAMEAPPGDRPGGLTHNIANKLYIYK
jgi:hypothetical protein